MPDIQTAFLLTMLGCSDVLAQPLAGLVAGQSWLRPIVIYLLSSDMLFNDFTNLPSSTAHDYADLVVFSVSYSMVGVRQVEVLKAVVGTHEFSSALGLVLLVKAVA